MANEDEIRSKAKELGFDKPQEEQAVQVGKDNPDLKVLEVLAKVRKLKI